MNSQPTVSVVVPCLNRARYLAPTLDSILGQDYPKIECIVVDGGSTDGTVDVLRRYDGEISWVSEPDEGHADAVNKGWRTSTGEVLAWLNADDLWQTPDGVRRALDYLQHNPDVDVVYGDCGEIDANGNITGMSYLHDWDLEYAVENCDHCIPQPASFIRRRVLNKVGWLDTTFRQKMDHDLWLRIGLNGVIRYAPGLLAYARALPDDTSHQPATASACTQLTRKFFEMPNVPDSLRKKRRRATSNAYLRGVDYAWRGGRHWPTVLSHGLRAGLTDPTNIRNSIRRLTPYLVAGTRLGRLAYVLRRGFRAYRLPLRAIRRLRRAILGLDKPSILNLMGDRDVEWSWIAAKMPGAGSRALDFGSGGSHLSLLAAERGYDVTALDLLPVDWSYTHPGLRSIQGDLFDIPLPNGHFDLVINCSTVEHVGLVGRYGVTDPRPDGDLEAMRRLRELMTARGVMLFTVPVGVDAVFAPLTRVYGERRLPRLLSGYRVDDETYWVKNAQNLWVKADRETALGFESSAGSWNPLQNVYALGCFVLRPGQD